MLHRNFKFLEEDTFEVGYNPQKEWAWLITAAFFLGEVGAGLFLVSLFLPGKVSLWSAILGWLIVAVGKNFTHFIYLGKPWRFWRMVFRPQTSWISRGFYATVALCGLGLVYIILKWLQIYAGASPTILSNLIMYVSGFCAFVVMIYDGIVMTYSPSLPLWNSSLLPILRLSYATMGGVTLSLLIAAIPSIAPTLSEVQREMLANLERWLIIANLIMIIVYILTLTYSVATAKESAYLIVKEKYPVVFWFGVVLVGLVVIFLLPAIVTTHSLNLLIFVALCELIGDFCILFLLIRAGVYSPLMPHPNIDPTLFSRMRA
jgi:formate-dependent nitrite reductase membrane component NrfD